MVNEIRCSHCGAPVPFNPGEIIVTCSYCGYTSVVETGEPFDFAHSMLLNEQDLGKVEESVFEWMRSGFLKPPDLERHSKILEKSLFYLPFWVISLKAETDYRGAFERLGPSVVKEGKIERKYNWLVLARKDADFPTKEYDVPLEGKIPYDFRRIERFANVLNSEVSRDEAVEIAKQQIEELHTFLMKKEVDKIIEVKTEIEIGSTVYLHVPIWFITYQYKNRRYRVILDSATGVVIKGDIPPVKFGIL